MIKKQSVIKAPAFLFVVIWSQLAHSCPGLKCMCKAKYKTLGNRKIHYNYFFITTTSATIHKILETNSSFYVEQCITGKVQFLFFSSFLLILTKFSFWEEDWALLFSNSWGNSYIPGLLLIITLLFTCGEKKICFSIEVSQNIINIVVCKKLFLFLFLY